MPVGSHKDAFKAHQLVKKLGGKDSQSVLAPMAANILLDFVKNQRQTNSETAIDTLPVEEYQYDNEKMDKALVAVSGLCGQCEEAHVDGCFVNQARRVLIAARTGADIGLEFDGQKTLQDLLSDAEKLASTQSSAGKANSSSNSDNAARNIESGDIDPLQQELETLREKDVFRGTLIDEIVATISDVANGNYAAEMPVHDDDEQLSKLAMSFNLMLKALSRTMKHLDRLVEQRNADLREIMNTVPVGLLSINQEYRINPEYSRFTETLLGVDNLRGRDFLDMLGLTKRNETERKLLVDYLELIHLDVLPKNDLIPLNPFPEMQLPSGSWVRLKYHALKKGGAESMDILAEMEDITEEHRLAAEVEEAQHENAQLKVIAEDPGLFRDFVSEIRSILESVTENLSDLESSSDMQERIHDMFRGIHTIKGGAGAMGLSSIAQVAGEIECSLGESRSSGSINSQEITQIRDDVSRLQQELEKTLQIARPILGEDVSDCSPVLSIPLLHLESLSNFMQDHEATQQHWQQALSQVESLLKVPASKAFSMLVRQAPSLAQKTAKDIEFTLKGGDTPVRYQTAKALVGPLTHLLRNAFDHGIESSDDRIAGGKPETGKVLLKVKQELDSLKLFLVDDGKGIDPEKMRQSAVRKGLINQEKADEMDDKSAQSLIFAPGFSTAEAVTDISGRGVGMDAVQVDVQKLGGSVEVQSTVGKGTMFTLNLLN